MLGAAWAADLTIIWPFSPGTGSGFLLIPLPGNPIVTIEAYGLPAGPYVKSRPPEREHTVVHWLRPSARMMRGVSPLFWAGLCACSSAEIDPDRLPSRFEQERVLWHDTRATDLDGDGRDELYYTYTPSGQSFQAVMLASHTDKVEQVNFTGRVQPPLFRDIDSDGKLEPLVPVTRNDSLFLTIVDANGRKRFSFFVTHGRPRIEPEGVIPWQATIVEVAVHDFDRDGSKELVSVVAAGYARAPRGVFVHRMRDGALLGQVLVGAAIRQAVIDDFDGNGLPEVFAVGQATNNGGDAGGFSDDQAYMMLFETWPAPTVKWHRRIHGKATIPQIAQADYTGDGRPEMLVVGAGVSPGFIEILDTRTWRPVRLREFNFGIGLSAAIDVDRDGRLEIVAPGPSQELLLFDDDLEIKTRTRVPMSVSSAATLPDLDGDGIQEVTVATSFNTGDYGFLLFGPRLDLKAAFTEGLPVGAMRTGEGVAPGVIVHRANRPPLLLKLRPNRLFLLQRFGPGAGAVAGTLTLLLAAAAFLRQRRRTRLLLSLRRLALEHSNDGLLLIDRKATIVWMNATLSRWCGRSPASGNGNPAGRIEDLPPELSAFCRECLAVDAPVPLASRATFRVGKDGQPLAARAEPATVGLRSDPHWLIKVRDNSAGSAELTAAWAPLARRTAHDLRNPLTSILLTLQRLQLEYRAAAPHAAPALDTYAMRLQQRVDQLRRLSSNFLKLLGAETLHLEKHELNTIVRESVDAIRRGLPPDLRLELQLEEDLPHVVVDREQIESVLENLVANSINALPEGGVITVSTQLARGLHLNSERNCDCVQLEVLDTGVGISRDVLSRIFEPGFSTSDHGSGLGLAIVKKIVNDHGGEVSVQSEAGTGTAFTILLPVATAVPNYAEV
jgi:signal transduction histidine kinase